MYYAGSDTNKHHGVGLLINKELNPSFMKISDRICVAKVVAKDRCILAISAYAPTLNMSEKYPELKEDFWSSIGLYRENAIAIESEAKYPFGGNVYYVTMQITLPIPELTRN